MLGHPPITEEGFHLTLVLQSHRVVAIPRVLLYYKLRLGDVYASQSLLSHVVDFSASSYHHPSSSCTVQLLRTIQTLTSGWIQNRETMSLSERGKQRSKLASPGGLMYDFLRGITYEWREDFHEGICRLDVGAFPI